MLGVYDYTVILTYMSLISATTGILVSLPGYGHPYIGVFFLLACGLCDAFDGMVARTKKNRTVFHKNFGVQIDSLSDLVAFGVLPACIGIAALRTSQYLDVDESKTLFQSLKAMEIDKIPRELIFRQITVFKYYHIVLISIAVFYVLAALIRLAYFNATEDERQKEMEATGKVHYTGLPVTSSALIFPFVMFLHFVTKFDFSILYFFVMLIVGILFLCKFKMKKIGKILLLLCILVGVIEFILLVLVNKG